jgi:hypothetical protein
MVFGRMEWAGKCKSNLMLASGRRSWMAMEWEINGKGKGQGGWLVFREILAIDYDTGVQYSTKCSSCTVQYTIICHLSLSDQLR